MYPIYNLQLAYQEAIESSYKKLLSQEERNQLIQEIKELLYHKEAVIVAHYYVDSEIQDLAEETGGIVADSLEMARFGKENSAKTLIVVGVRFMGETAKILSPEKQILVPDIRATCSLDETCPADDFSSFRKKHSDRVAVVYANTSAAVKAMSDWVVTSGSAYEIIKDLHAQNKKILWASDANLGHYLMKKTGSDILIWQGYCIVHQEFNALALEELLDKFPQAKILAHPESPDSLLKKSHFIGSTSQIIRQAEVDKAQHFIIATESGILHKLRKQNPEKTFFLAPTANRDQKISCTACSHCPWMKMNSLEGIRRALKEGRDEIILEEEVIRKAQMPLEKMLAFMRNLALS